jgi:hypothetical protein
MLRKRVLITLPVNAYRRLAEMATVEERVIDQQASLLLKRLLLDVPHPAAASPGMPEHDGLPASVETNPVGGLS